MTIPSPIHRFWCSLDELFASVEPTPWGAVVTDGRFPRIWDANYARIDPPGARVDVADIEAALLPALAEAGADTFHVVSFVPEATTGLLAELSSRGDRLSWDVVMAVEAGGSETTQPIEQLRAGEELWSRVGDSLALFGVDGAEAVTQLRQIEEQVLAPGGKRWFGIRDADDEIVSLAALLVMDAIGYIDNVLTFPQARGRGLASAITSHLVREARRARADRVFLLADPDEEAVVRMYAKLGFEEVGRIASTRGPIPP